MGLKSPLKPLEQSLTEIDAISHAITCRATDYPADFLIKRHKHGKHQLIYAVHGVMLVHTEAGHWVVPPTRAIWMPAGISHSIHCVGIVNMRSLFIQPEVVQHLPQESRAVGISPLLRELITASVEVSQPCQANSRDGRLLHLMLDEMNTLPTLPLHLPQPNDARLRRICTQLQRNPDDQSTLSDWAKRLDIDGKTIQRLFARETGMTFGQWRTQIRLLHALQRLASGDKIVDIALELGYESPGAFATMFKRQFGKTPSQFFR